MLNYTVTPWLALMAREKEVPSLGSGQLLSCMFAPCSLGFPLGTLVSAHNPKTSIVAWVLRVKTSLAHFQKRYERAFILSVKRVHCFKWMCAVTYRLVVTVTCSCRVWRGREQEADERDFGTGSGAPPFAPAALPRGPGGLHRKEIPGVPSVRANPVSEYSHVRTLIFNVVLSHRCAIYTIYSR